MKNLIVIQERPTKPVGSLSERITRLNREFNPEIFRLATFMPDNSTSIEKLKLLENLVDAVEELEAFIKNGNSDEGLWFKYNVVKV